MPDSEKSRRRRLLVVRPSLGQGGADRVTVTLLRHLDRTLFEPSLALMFVEGPYLEEIPDDVRIHDLGGGTLWTAWLPLARLVMRTRPDILFSTSSGANVVAALATFLTRSKPRLVLSERSVLNRPGRSWKRWVLRLAKRLLYRRADCVTAVSGGVAADLEKELSLDPMRIRVVYSPIVTADLEELASRPLRPEARDLPTPWILGVGRLVPAKGFDTLIRAFARVRDNHDVRLRLLGEGPLKPDLEALADDLGVLPHVRFEGFVANPFAFMSRATVFVLSSRREGLPGALIQAMASGAAVVATDCHAGPSEILEPGTTGLLVPVGDDRAMAAAIDCLIESAELRRSLAASGARAVSRFRVPHVLDRYQTCLLGSLDTTAGEGTP